MSVTVSRLTIVPVKGMQVCQPDEVRLERQGPAGDRAFFVVDTDNRIVRTTRTPALQAVAADWDAARDVLTLRFPDGSVVSDTPKPGAAATTRLHGDRPVSGRLVAGPPAAALSDHLGQEVRLLRRAESGMGADDAPVTMISEASVAALAPELGGRVPDPRRFRMSLTLSGATDRAEHGWVGREVVVGEARLRVLDPVPRCVVTTRNPDSGVSDERILHALSRLHGSHDLTLGVWCEVLTPGTVHLGDPVLFDAAPG